jgi:hypothetical protein
MLYHPILAMLLMKRWYTFLSINQFGIMQIHIGFCIFAAIAPPVVFHGKSLT